MIARRPFLATLAFGIVSRPFGAVAQAPPKMPRVGILVPQARSGRLPVDAFVEALRELGHADGRSIGIEWRYSEGKSERLPALARELVQLGVDVIHAVGPDAVEAARNATTTIPIVGVGGADPVLAGWAASLARPGGNITGMTVGDPGLPGKHLELLKEVIPRLTRVAALFDSNHFSPGSPLKSVYLQRIQDPARHLGVQLHMLGVSGPGEFEKAFTSAARWRAQALHVNETPMLHSFGVRLAELAARNRLPSIGLLQETAVLKANVEGFERLLAHNRETKIVWAHAGSDPLGYFSPKLVRELIGRHPNLALSIRPTSPRPGSMVHPAGDVNGDWVALLRQFPDRFVLGSDTMIVATHYTGPNTPRFFANRSEGQRRGIRQLLSVLPSDLARRIGYENAERLYKLGP